MKINYSKCVFEYSLVRCTIRKTWYAYKYRPSKLLFVFQKTGNTDVVYMQLDLGSLQAVHSFTETFLKTEARWDLLSGHIVIKRRHEWKKAIGLYCTISDYSSGLVVDGRTADGFAIEFGVNHLGHFLLTCLLLDHLKEGT